LRLSLLQTPYRSSNVTITKQPQVGPTGGGKTTCYRALQRALTESRKEGHPSDKYQTVHTHVLNPKCIKMGELYGEYNLLTNEWTDGLVSFGFGFSHWEVVVAWVWVSS